MARHAHQNPTLRRSKTKGGKRDRWYFRAYVPVLGPDGTTAERVEREHHVGYCSEMTVTAAKQEMARQVAIINQPAVVLSGQVKFGVILDKFLVNTDVKPQTFRGYTSTVEAHLRPRWGEVRISDMTPLAVEEWIRGKAKGMAKTTCTHVRLRFNQVWKCALRWGFTQTACPMLLIPRIAHHGKPKRKKTQPTAAQYLSVLQELEQPFRNIVWIAAETGMRRGEVMALRWKQTGGPYLTIVESMTPHDGIGSTKTEGSERTVPFRRIRLTRPEGAGDDDFVFHVGCSTVNRAIREALQVVGIYEPGFGIHRFRHMHNTLLRRVADAEVAQAQLGHSDKKTNDGYTAVDYDAELKKRDALVELAMGGFVELGEREIEKGMGEALGGVN